MVPHMFISQERKRWIHNKQIIAFTLYMILYACRDNVPSSCWLNKCTCSCSSSHSLIFCFVDLYMEKAAIVDTIKPAIVMIRLTVNASGDVSGRDRLANCDPNHTSALILNDEIKAASAYVPKLTLSHNASTRFVICQGRGERRIIKTILNPPCSMALDAALSLSLTLSGTVSQRTVRIFCTNPYATNAPKNAPIVAGMPPLGPYT